MAEFDAVGREVADEATKERAVRLCRPIVEGEVDIETRVEEDPLGEKALVHGTTGDPIDAHRDEVGGLDCRTLL